MIRRLILAVLLLTGYASAQCAPFTDSFSGSGALSGNWTNAPGFGSSTIVQASGVAQSGAGPGTGAAIVTGCTFSANQAAQAVYTAFAGGNVMVLVRATTGGNGYGFYLGTGGNEILKLTSGGGSPIGSGSCIPSAGATYGISAIGTTITVTMDGVTCATATDSTYSSGAPGLFLNPSGAASGAEAASFQAEDDSLLVSAGTCTGSTLNVTQLTSFAGCQVSASGATGSVTWSISSNSFYQTLPDGMSLNASTGAISSSRINGQGVYNAVVVATDSASNTANVVLTFAAASDNTFGGTKLCGAPTSVFCQRLDSLPIDTTSPFHSIYPGYAAATLQAEFGQSAAFGIPINTVPSTQTFVTVTAGINNLTSGPWSPSLAIEGGWNTIGVPNTDHHIPIFIQAGANPAALYESYQLYPNGDGTWGDGSGGSGSAAFAFYPSSPPNIASFDMPPQDSGTANAAGASIAAGLITYSEVKGTGGVGSENGAILHAMNITVPNTLNVYVWPGTARAGLGGSAPCTGGYEDINGLVTQSASHGGVPTLCQSMSSGALNPMGQTFLIPAGTSEPSQCSSNNVMHIIFVAAERYGFRITDNGNEFGLEGVPDPNWPSATTINNCLGQLPAGNWISPAVDSLAAIWPNSSQTVTAASSSMSGAATLSGGATIQ